MTVLASVTTEFPPEADQPLAGALGLVMTTELVRPKVMMLPKL